MTAEDQLVEDYKAFENLATGGHESKAKSQTFSGLDGVDPDQVKHRYCEALAMLYMLGWNPPAAKE